MFVIGFLFVCGFLYFVCEAVVMSIVWFSVTWCCYLLFFGGVENSREFFYVCLSKQVSLFVFSLCNGKQLESLWCGFKKEENQS